MEIAKKILFAIFSFFILFLFIWALYLPKSDVNRTIADIFTGQKNKIDLIYKGVVFEEIDNGVKYWELKAASSSLDNRSKIVVFENTKGTFFKNSSPTLYFVSPNASWFIDSKKIILIKPLGFDSPSEPIAFFPDDKENYFQFPSSSKKNGLFFKAEKLTWDMKNKKIICKDGLWFKKGNVKGYAGMLEADVDMKKIYISKSPKIYMATDKGITIIESSSFTIDNENNSIYSNQKTIITGDEFITSANSSFYDRDKETIMLGQNVKISNKKFYSLSQHGEYNIIEGTITLTGKPKVFQGDNFVSGDKIIVDLKNKNFFTVGEKSKIKISEEEIKEEL